MPVVKGLPGPNHPFSSGAIVFGAKRPDLQKASVASTPEPATSEDPMQPGIDAHEAAMAARRKQVDAEKTKAGTSGPTKPTK